MNKMSAKRSPRAMPVETIITRFKSRNQQFGKERQKRVTKPISPKSKTICKPLKQYVGKLKDVNSSKNVQKRSVKVNDIDSCEFYPDKPKRNIEYKKVVLMPKHCMKMIGGTKSCNKRKLRMPRKELKRSRRDSNTSMLSDIEPKSPKNKDQDEELTIKDMVLLIEEQGGLNDEDLLEILTCPSPVWWEDPPDGYIEEPIFARPKPAEQKSVKNQLLEEQNKEAERRKLRDEESTLKGTDTENLDVSKLRISVENRGINFMNKRCKLESLLGSIRNKVKGSDDGFKQGDKNASDDLNASNSGKNCNKSQTTVSIQKKINETVTDELNTKTTEKCGKQVDYNAINKNRTVELKPINTEKCYRNVENKPKNKLNVLFKHKIMSNSNRKVENKSKKLISTLKLKEVITIDENPVSNACKNQNKSMSQSDQNHEHIATSNRDKRSSESFEDLIDLDDQEILSLENMEIPIAHVKVTNPIITSNPPAKRKETSCNQLTTTNSSAKINHYNCGKEMNCFEKENSANKLGKSAKTTKYIDNDFINSKIEQENSNNRVKEINKETENENSQNRVKDIDKEINNKFSYMRVKNILTLTNSDTSCASDAILGEMTPDSVKIKILTASKNYKDSRSCMKNVNNRLSDNSPVLQEDDCIQIQDDDFNNRKSETKHTSVKIDNLTDNDTSIQIENKLTDNHYHERKNVINNARRYSIDSATSDKNMSVEYLDMSLLDEDERKIELENQNNEYNNECNDYESQSDSQTCNKNNHINFKSDLDMTDSNMYDQINESCNSDIIKYIRDNQKDIDAIQDEDFNMNDKTLRSSSPIQENAISNKLTPDKENVNKDKRTKYVTVYKVINSDSENECNSGKIEVKGDALNGKNEVNISKLNEIKEGSLMENNVIDDSELIAYEEEYLTEFDEIEIVGNEKRNVNKTGEVGNATLNLCNYVKLNNSNEIITADIHKQGSSSKTVKGNTIEVNIKEDLTKINDVPVSVEDAFKNHGNSNNTDPPKVTDKSNKHLNNYYKYLIDIRTANKNNEIIPNNKSKRQNHENVIKTKKIDCNLCNFKNKSISVSENNTVKYCLLCSSIYDTENCKYCIKNLKKECSCTKKINLEYVCDKCNQTMCDKEAIVAHLKMNCNVVTHTE